MSNSPLIDCTLLSPNHSGKRTHTIDRITPHCFVGQVTVERGLEVFQPRTKNASCSYVIGTDGRIGLCVDEDNRSWCSSSNANDQRAITIECASDNKAPYAFNNSVYNKLVDLCVDICKRYNKKKLIWIADKDKALNYNPNSDEMLLTVHRWFANKSCPGDWLFSRLSILAYTVTEKLSTTTPTEILYKVQVGAYKVKQNAINQKAKLEKEGYQCFIVTVGNYYKVQVGAFKDKQNAINLQTELKAKGYSCFITN